MASTWKEFLEKAADTPINEQLSGNWDNKYYGRETVTAQIKDAPEKYSELYNDCKQYLKDINQALDEHKSKFGNDEFNWSHG